MDKMNDLTLDKNYRKGDKNGKVKLIQEWLCLHGFLIKIDDDFGPATEDAVKQFQKKNALEVDGIVGNHTFGALIQPMLDALKNIEPAGHNLGEMVVLFARQHLAQHPREVGGQNMGPWVRLYMLGNEGNNWPWCAGFASYILQQACTSLKANMPVDSSFSCDLLAQDAKAKGILIDEASVKDKTQIKPGHIFLVRKGPGDWTHTGLVTEAKSDLFYTIEGNTNDEGTREGYEVCNRTRGYKNIDFIKI
jgi:hypothetical protein